jgi:2-polyprenyl-3-methyl-5-hydroxy-6-metoxy-1,4-benzoquinol methylase
MTIRVDAEGHETAALFGLVDLKGKDVLEVGSGDGRLTWRFAGRAAHVSAIEPYAPSADKAKQDIPKELKGRIEFLATGFDEFAARSRSETFDVLLNSWSLC